MIADESRALDIAISRHVFGHDIKPEWESWLPNVPPYSTSIASAWLVVDRMLELGWQYVVEGDPGGDTPAWATFIRVDPYSRSDAEAATPSLAICRAALLAARGSAADAGRDGETP